MSPPHSQSTPYKSVLLIVLSLSQAARAALSLQELQPIAHFPQACQNAYQTPIQACPDASSFSVTGSTGAAVCTNDCYAALISAVANIQHACQGTAAPPGTIIAHAFSGDLAYFLCGPTPSRPPGNTSPSTTIPQSSTPASASSGNGASTSQVPSQTASTEPGATSGSSIDTKTGTSLSTSTRSSASTSPSESTSSATAASTSSRSTITSLTTSKSTSSTSHSTKPEPTLNPGGGGSPFDQTVPNAAPTPIHSQNMMPLVVGVAFAVALGS